MNIFFVFFSPLETHETENRIPNKAVYGKECSISPEITTFILKLSFYSDFFFSVEDPSEEFVRLRDFVDAQNCLEQVKSMNCMEAVSKGFTDAMATEANQKLKLCKRQARRVYEILRLHFVRKAGGLTDKNSGYKDFRIDVKKRLNMPFQVRFFFQFHNINFSFNAFQNQNWNFDFLLKYSSK